MTHKDLAMLWARWNGQRGTDKQLARIMSHCSADELRRMLVERGVAVSA